jgi:hypothetical protein
MIRQMASRALLVVLAAALTNVNASVAVAQTRFDRDAVRSALRDVAAAAPAARLQEEWNRVVQLSSGTRVIVRLDDGRTVDGRVQSADANGLRVSRDEDDRGEMLARSAITEVQTVQGRRGSVLGAIIGGGAGVFLGVGSAVYFAQRQCGASCGDEKVLIGLSLVGLPTAGALGGYHAFGGGGRTTIYRAPRP